MQTSFVLKIQANVSTMSSNRPNEWVFSKLGRLIFYFRELQCPFPCHLLENEILFGIMDIVILQNIQCSLHEKLPAFGQEII